MMDTKRNIGSGEDCPDVPQSRRVIEKLAELLNPTPQGERRENPAPPVPPA